MKEASSVQRVSLRRVGRPAKRSRIEPVRSFCWGVRETPAEVGMLVVSTLYCVKGGEEVESEDMVARCWGRDCRKERVWVGDGREVLGG